MRGAAKQKPRPSGRDLRGNAIKLRSLKTAWSIIGCAIIAVIGVMAIDQFIAHNAMNPVPAAESAIAAQGFPVDPLHVRSFEATGGLFGSRAVVNYQRTDAGKDERLEVQLRRPLFHRDWEVVAVAKK